MRGRYIVFEGTVGTGKTTQVKKILGNLKESFPNLTFVMTREPGGSEIADNIRKSVQGTEYKEGMEPICEAYLYAASRAQTIRTIIIPALENGSIVLSDRSFITSLAYQGAARGLGIETVLEINNIAIGNIVPDLVIYFDVSPEVGLQRTFDQKGDKFEKEDIDFFKSIESGYRVISKLPAFKDRWVNIDASGSVDLVFERIRTKIIPFLQAS